MKLTMERLRLAGVPYHHLHALEGLIGESPEVSRLARRVVDKYTLCKSLEETIDDIRDSGMVQGTEWQRKMLAHYRPMRLRARRAHKAAHKRLIDRLTAAA